MLESFDGTEIHFDFYANDSSSAILIVPGFWRYRTHPAMLKLTEQLLAIGYPVVVMDSRGHGDSKGVYGFNNLEHHDVAAVVDDMAGPLGMSRITIIGFSYGAAIAITATARHELPVAALLLFSAVADMDQIAPRLKLFSLHRHIALNQALHRPDFVWRLRRSPKFNAIDDVGRLHIPICFIHVENDWLIGHQHSLALFERANEPKELHLLEIPGNYHADRILRVAADYVEPVMWRFLARYMPLETPG